MYLASLMKDGYTKIGTVTPMGNLESPAHLTSTSLGSWNQMHGCGEDVSMGTTKNFTAGLNFFKNFNHFYLNWQ